MATYPNQIRNLDAGQCHLHHPPQPWTVSSISLPLNLLGDEDIASHEQNNTPSFTTEEPVASSTPRCRFSFFIKHRASKASKADSVIGIVNNAKSVTKLDTGMQQGQCTLESQAIRPGRSSFRSSFASFFDILRFRNGSTRHRSSTFRTSKPAFLFSSVDGLSTMTDPYPHFPEEINSSSNNNNDIATSLQPPLSPLPPSPTPSKFKSKRSLHVSSLGHKSLPPPPRPKQPSYKPVRSPQQYKDSGVTHTQGYYPLLLANNERYRTFSDTPLDSSTGPKKKRRSMYTCHVERAKTIHHQHTQKIVPPWNNTAKPLSRIMTTPVKGSRPQREGHHLFEYETMPLQPPNSPSDAESKQVGLISPQELQQQRATFHDTYLNGYGNNKTNSEKRSMEKKPSFGNFGARTGQSSRLLDADPARLTISRYDGKDSSSICLSNAENGGNIRREETTSISDNKDCNKPAVIQTEDMAFELVKPLDLNKIQAQQARRAKATYSAYIRHRSLKATASYDVDIN